MDKKVFLLDKEHYTSQQVESLTEKDLEEWVADEDYGQNYTIIKIDANSYSTADEAIKEEMPCVNADDYYVRSFGFDNEKNGTMRQVNCTTNVDGVSSYWISEHSDDGYVGILTDTVYEDGSDYTDWCQFVGTQEECEAYIKENKKRGLRKGQIGYKGFCYPVAYIWSDFGKDYLMVADEQLWNDLKDDVEKQEEAAMTLDNEVFYYVTSLMEFENDEDALIDHIKKSTDLDFI